MSRGPEVKALSVSALVAAAGRALDELGPQWVAGEVFEYRGAHASGHRYFKLRDEDASISVILWRGTAARALHCDLEEGRQVLVHGNFEIYPQRGSLSFLLDHVEDLGGGDLAKRFEQAKARLRAEGLFDLERKRPIPARPRRIAVICGGASAAEADILRALHAAPAPLEILLLPTRVQGEGAAEELASALARAASVAPDVILLARGGGSLEDLWAFNEEALVRAVADCPVPTVVAVGHESDTTLCDLAADERAMTPTAGAAGLLEGWRELLGELARLGRRLERRAHSGIQAAARPLAALQRRFREQSPERRLHRLRHRLGEAERRLWQGAHEPLRAARRRLERRLARLQQASPERRLASWRTRLDRAEARLQGANPQALLARGYALVERRVTAEEGGPPRYLRDASEAPRGTPLRIQLAEGSLDATVD
ncbi:MAG: exodeoxyribonuclease VII large subunit [Planctomycetota bacterium]